MSESKIVQHIDVDVPANIAYNQWTQFEQFPRFMEGVEQVEQLTDDTVRFTVAVGPKKLTYVAEIVDQQPDRRSAARLLAPPNFHVFARFSRIAGCSSK